MTAPTPAPPDDAVGFVRIFGFWYWDVGNGRIRSCIDWRYWLELFGGECRWEHTPAEPGDAEFIEMMGW